MKALVCDTPGEVRFQDWPDPRILHPRDAIVRVTSTAICGTDLHVYRGLMPQTSPHVMGHEFMGIVEEIGPEVIGLAVGERIVVPFVVACGRCWFCEHGLPTHCENSSPNYGPEGGLLDQKGGGMIGLTDLYGGYDGGQAELARVPYAGYGPRKVPQGEPDEKYLFVSDILPTGWIAAEWAGIRGGEIVAVFGCGPVGLMAQKSAWVQGASRVIGLDPLDYRLEMARKAARSETINPDSQDAVGAIREMTEGRGADACIDAVGMEYGGIAAFSLAVSAVRRGGRVTVVGVYGTPSDNFPWGQIFDKGLTIRAGAAPVQNRMDHVVRLIQDGKMVADDIITHTLPLSAGPEAYRMFNDKADRCVKVVLKP